MPDLAGQSSVCMAYTYIRRSGTWRPMHLRTVKESLIKYRWMVIKQEKDLSAAFRRFYHKQWLVKICRKFLFRVSPRISVTILRIQS